MHHSISMRIKPILLVLSLCFLPNLTSGQSFYPHTPNRRNTLDDTPQLTAFKAGFKMLNEGASFDKVLAQWETALNLSPDGIFAAQLKDYTETLRKQVAQHSELPILSADAIAALPEKQRIDYFVGQLPEVRGDQFSLPGRLYTTYSPACEALIKIGRPAVSALTRCLNERRLTRSVVVWHRYFPAGDVLRVQDAALQCVEQILHLHFDMYVNYDHLSFRAPQKRAQIAAEIGSWWERNSDKTPLVGYLDLLDTLVKNHATLYDRVQILEKIEAIDKNAIDSVARLKSWQLEITAGLNEREDYAGQADSANRDAHAYYAVELTRRGDSSLLPAMRAMLKNSKDDLPEEAVWCLLKRGTDADYEWLRRTIKKEVADVGKSDSGEYIAWAVLESTPGQEYPRLPAILDRRMEPLLVEMLTMRRASGTKQSTGKPNASVSNADRAMSGLIFLTHHDEGYDSWAPESERFPAMDHWLAWWRTTQRVNR